ncbi:MAG: DUF2384 domain-containing protein [Gammaproteobacteria bacterium]|nr:DUF2384 domain-containing protein [Gammaproteobacteria bacterium]MDH5729739.1 DUF2384 domain-containing protein [Gammaproteobacteria bacterium]
MAQTHPQTSPEAVLTKAVLAAADYMAVKQTTLAKILGLSTASVSRMREGRYELKTHGKEWELAGLFVRLFRGLDAIMAGDEQSLQSWMRNYNQALGETPIKLIPTITGLTKTLDYVDAYRARV